MSRLHGRHHEAHFDRQRAPKRLDLLGQPVAAVRRIDQRQKRVAELDLEVIHLQRSGDGLVGGIGFDCRLGFPDLRCRGELHAPVDDEGERAGAAAEREERDHRNSGQQRHHNHHGPRHAESLGVTRKLPQQRLVCRAGHARLGDKQAGRGGTDQRGDLRDQAVAHREDHVRMRGIRERKTLARCR